MFSGKKTFRYIWMRKKDFLKKKPLETKVFSTSDWELSVFFIFRYFYELKGKSSFRLVRF